MANNRLFIRDTETGDEFILAKCYCGGWFINRRGQGQQPFEEELGVRLEERDSPGAYGGYGRSSLILICENDPEYRGENHELD